MDNKRNIERSKRSMLSSTKVKEENQMINVEIILVILCKTFLFCYGLFIAYCLILAIIYNLTRKKERKWRDDDE